MAETRVTEGYFMTKVGLIPKDWEISSLQNISDIRISNVDKKSGPDEIPVRLCNYMDVFGNDYITSQMEFMNATATEAEISKFSLKKNDVLFTKDSETREDIASTAVVIDDLENVVCGYHLGILRPKEGVDGRYFSKVLSSHEVRKYFIRYASGVTRFGLALPSLQQALIPLPPLPEQRGIATVLNTVDEAITTTKEIINRSKELKRGLMQDLLTKGIDEEGKIRSEETHEFWDSPIGRVPVDWEVEKIGNIFPKLSTGSTPRRDRPDYYTGNIPWITSGELNYSIITDTIEKITSEAVRDTNLKIYPPGTFFIAITGLEAEGTRGRCGISAIEATTNQSCMAFPKNDLIETNFLFHFYRKYGNTLFFRFSQGTKQQSLNGKILKHIPIPLPPLTEQNSISQILNHLDSEDMNLHENLFKLSTLKEGLMQDLLTGRKRIPGEMIREICLTETGGEPA